MKKTLVFAALFAAGLSIIFAGNIIAAEADMAAQIKLPQPKTDSVFSLEKAIQERRSVRSFKPQNLDLGQISQVLWAAQGITDKGAGLRTAPSAGAIYPLKMYIVKSDGLFVYIPDGHKIAMLSNEDLRRRLSRAARGQGFVAETGMDIIITADLDKITSRYGQRGAMYAHIEAGHVAQNIHLQAVALGLVSVPVGAFVDNEVKSVINLPKNEEPLYIIPVGYPK